MHAFLGTQIAPDVGVPKVNGQYKRETLEILLHQKSNSPYNSISVS